MPETRTYADRREYLLKAVPNRRRALKQMAIEYKGGKCEKCGYDKCVAALEFHHRNPEEKDLAVSKYRKGWETLRKELDKCEMLCANCHREIHYLIVK